MAPPSHDADPTPAARSTAIRTRLVPALALAAALAAALVARAGALSAQRGAPAEQLAPYTERIPGTLVTFEMLPVPGVPVQSSIATGAAQPVRTLWVMKTEVSWDLYDVFVFGFDQPEDRRGTTNAADAFARPSKPYVLPGDAFGHKGYPALGMSLLAAKEFAKWLSARTGRPYRLPTEAEWVHICRAGQGATAGDSARGGAPRGSAAGTAGVWHAANSKEQTQPVGTLPPDALGVHDMLGNAAEWVVAGTDSVVMGGAWDSEPSDVSCTASRRQSPAWNVSDPQLPKSRWWLTDAFFVGLRLVRDQ